MIEVWLTLSDASIKFGPTMFYGLQIGSNQATLTAMAIHLCCSDLGNIWSPLLYGAGVVLLKPLPLSVNIIDHTNYIIVTYVYGIIIFISLKEIRLSKQFCSF